MKERNEIEESRQLTISRGFVVEMVGEKMPRTRV